MGRHRRGGDVPIPPDHVDGDIDRSRLDPDRAHHILGADGYAIMGGLLVATLLTLLFLPALYVAWFRVKEPVAGEQG